MQDSGYYQDMGNFILSMAFPSPRPTYSFEDDDVFTVGENENRVVIRLVKRQGQGKSTRVIIFFHGNGEDIGESEYLLGETMEKLQAHLVCVEYPQYGPYKWAQISEPRSAYTTSCVIL